MRPQGLPPKCACQSGCSWALTSAPSRLPCAPPPTGMSLSAAPARVWVPAAKGCPALMRAIFGPPGAGQAEGRGLSRSGYGHVFGQQMPPSPSPTVPTCQGAPVCLLCPGRTRVTRQ